MKTQLLKKDFSRKSVKVSMQTSLVHFKPVYLQIAEPERLGFPNSTVCPQGTAVLYCHHSTAVKLATATEKQT